MQNKLENVHCAISLASFPGLPTVQFLITCSMQKGRGRPGPFYPMNDVSVYQGRQRGEGSPIKRMRLFLHTASDKKQNWTAGRPGNEATIS